MVRKTERKKFSMKSRLLIIVVMFIVINLVFYVGSEFSDESKSEKQIEQFNQSEDPPYSKFNPPLPSP